MINRNALNKARRAVLKCAIGSSMTYSGSAVYPITEAIKEQFAKENNYTYKDSKFYLIDSDGNETELLPSQYENDLQTFANKKAIKDIELRNAPQFINSVDAALFSSNSNIMDQSTLTQGINAGYKAATDIATELNPIAGTAMSMWGFASDTMTAAGLKTDGLTGFDKIADSKALPIIGQINALGASKSNPFSIDYKAFEQVGGDYGGLWSQSNEALSKVGTYGLFSSGKRKRANEFIDDTQKKVERMGQVAKEATDQQNSVAAMSDIASTSYFNKTSNRYQQQARHVKQGGVMEEVPEFTPEFIEPIIASEERIIPGLFSEGGSLSERINPTTGQIEEWKSTSLNASWNPVLIEAAWNPEIVTTMKSGGRVEKQLDAPEIEETTQQNVIPEGALHKDKHHMENAENMTKKGIPVVDDKQQQQAEIERNEIIFTKEVTKKLEELCKAYYAESATNKEKDELAIEAGKLLTKEIMLNTDDRTGLINTLQTGGTINENKPSYEEWIKDINPEFVNDNYDLEMAYKVLPYTQLQQWKEAVSRETPPEGTDWHLPSVVPLDDDTYIFLKKGKTAKENPELQYEFDAYNDMPEFKKEYKMIFNKDENRWYYKRRKVKNS